jgi:hypothetical protein
MCQPIHESVLGVPDRLPRRRLTPPFTPTTLRRHDISVISRVRQLDQVRHVDDPQVVIVASSQYRRSTPITTP